MKEIQEKCMRIRRLNMVLALRITVYQILSSVLYQSRGLDKSIELEINFRNINLVLRNVLYTYVTLNSIFKEQINEPIGEMKSIPRDNSGNLKSDRLVKYFFLLILYYCICLYFNEVSPAR